MGTRAKVQGGDEGEKSGSKGREQTYITHQSSSWSKFPVDVPSTSWPCLVHPEGKGEQAKIIGVGAHPQRLAVRIRGVLHQIIQPGFGD